MYLIKSKEFFGENEIISISGKYKIASAIVKC